MNITIDTIYSGSSISTINIVLTDFEDKIKIPVDTDTIQIQYLNSYSNVISVDNIDRQSFNIQLSKPVPESTDEILINIIEKDKKISSYTICKTGCITYKWKICTTRNKKCCDINCYKCKNYEKID